MVLLNLKNSLFAGNPRGERTPSVGMTSLRSSISPNFWSIFLRYPSANYAHGCRINGRAVIPHVLGVF
jgi:hypothetical protein